MRTKVTSVDERIIRRATLRIGLQMAAAVAVAVLGLTAIAALLELRGQHTAEDRLINATIDDTDGVDDVAEPPPGVWVAIRLATGLRTSPGLPAGLPDRSQLSLVAADGRTRTVDATLAGRDYRIVTEHRPGQPVTQAVADLSADEAASARLLESSLITGAVGLLIAAVVGVWLGRRAVAPLANALALQRRFVADASHELRTPLTLLSTRAQLIRRALAPLADVGTVRQDVDRLVTDTAQLTEVLNDLLVAADPREAPADQVVVLADLVDDAIESARPAAERLGVSLAWASDDERSMVLGSPTSLRRAVTALLDNAIRHATGSVCVTVAASGGDAVVDVRDDGPGVAPDVMVSMFDRFATASSEHRPDATRRYGLGLALVNEVAAHHGGSVSVVDTGRRGATLRLRLPTAH
jgi:signal transduction histidine kinase